MPTNGRTTNPLFATVDEEQSFTISYDGLSPKLSIKKKKNLPDTIMNDIIKIDKNGKIGLDFNFKKRSQIMVFQELMRLDFNKAIEYLKSFKGIKVNDKHLMVITKQIPKDFSPDHLECKIPNCNLALQRDTFNSNVDHEPISINQGSWIGVEIECLIPLKGLNKLRIENGFSPINNTKVDNCDCGGNDEFGPSCDGHYYDATDDEQDHEEFFSTCYYSLRKLANTRKLKRVNIKGDGSLKIEKGYFPVEFTILFTKKDRNPLKDLCDFLKDLEAKVNYSCGLHVHFDQRNLVNKNGRDDLDSLREKGRKLRYVLPILAEMIPYSRRKNRYCIQKVSRIDGDRYSAINLTAFQKYKTLEVRLHSGTTIYNKINNWIDILLTIMESKTLKRKCANIDELFEVVDFKEKLMEYMISRIKLFKTASQQEAA